MSEEQKTPITLKSTATALSSAATKAANRDLRPAGRLLKKLIYLAIGLSVVLIGVGLIVGDHVKGLRSEYEREAIFGAPLPAGVTDEILMTFTLIKIGAFDAGKYVLIDSLNEKKGRKLLGQVSKYCGSSGRSYAANVKSPFDVIFETKAFKRLARTRTNECVDEVVRGILSRNPDKQA